mmetsp:Transcript_63840/g.170511  ORF Transcript_63840/g.170511 Transcript_63840/m.170511 type:complete len:257 (+) Transcript_63840:572-1342(+)
MAAQQRARIAGCRNVLGHSGLAALAAGRVVVHLVAARRGLRLPGRHLVARRQVSGHRGRARHRAGLAPRRPRVRALDAVVRDAAAVDQRARCQPAVGPRRHHARSRPLRQEALRPALEHADLGDLHERGPGRHRPKRQPVHGMVQQRDAHRGGRRPALRGLRRRHQRWRLGCRLRTDLAPCARPAAALAGRPRGRGGWATGRRRRGGRLPAHAPARRRARGGSALHPGLRAPGHRGLGAPGARAARLARRPGERLP